MPFDRTLYPQDWPAISRRIRDRSGGRCEGPIGRDRTDDAARCTARDRLPHPRTGSRVILTVAHQNHQPMDCSPQNLWAVCQACHLAHDRANHVRVARENRRRKKACGDLFRGSYPQGQVHAHLLDE